MNLENLQNKIYNIRGVQVMLDSDLSSIYGVEKKRLSEQVKRNIDRFPQRFRFQLTKQEFENYEKSLRSQNATLKKGQGEHSKYLLCFYGTRGLN